MMLAKRIIPTILMKRRQLVQGRHFKPDRVVGNVLQAARIHAMRQVDEILMLDVTATAEGREPDYSMVKDLTRTAFVPVTVGGGVTKVGHAKRLFDSGADKVALGKDKHNLIYQLSERFGRQAVTVTVPFEYQSGESIWQMCIQAQADGAGEIVLQSVEREGTMTGYDLNAIDLAARTVTIPVIASGGCSGYDDMENALQRGADAVSAGTLFLFTECTPKLAAQNLHQQGIEVRAEV
jgi:cyclase